MSNIIHSLMDVFALASSALVKNHILSPNCAGDVKALFNVWVTEQNGDRTLVRENLPAQLCDALVEAGNHGAKVKGLARKYEAVPVVAFD